MLNGGGSEWLQIEGVALCPKLCVNIAYIAYCSYINIEVKV